MENPIAIKLDALLKLQAIDSELDRIIKIRGDLPEEVQDLEDELIGYDTRVTKFKDEIEVYNGQIAEQRQSAKEAEKLIEKYNDQQLKIRNNREYDAISKEIESQQLDIKLAEKQIKELHYRIGLKDDELSKLKSIVTERKKDLKAKKGELDEIVAESQEDEAKLRKQRAKAEERH